MLWLLNQGDRFLILLAIYGQQGIKNCPLDSCKSISKSISFLSNIKIFCQERYNWPFFHNDGRILTKSCVIRSEEDGSHGPLFSDWFGFLIKDLILHPVGQKSGVPRRTREKNAHKNLRPIRHSSTYLLTLSCETILPSLSTPI